MAPDIRPARPEDWPAIWDILRPVFRAGDTYAYPPDIDADTARQTWTGAPARAFVAQAQDRIVGTFFIKPNQPGQGSHVCNCGYAVAPDARGRGVAGAMCAASQDLARDMGFAFMQFNLVVATNTTAVALWQRLGFDIVATLPGAFRHARLGLVDAHVMYKAL